MSEPNEVEELRLDLRDARLTLAEAHNAMRRMQHHIDTLTSDKMTIGAELYEARKVLDRVKALIEGRDYGWTEEVRAALMGADDV